MTGLSRARRGPGTCCRARRAACLSAQLTRPRFANARSVRNVLEGARLRHAYRLASEPERPWTKDDLMRLETPDILPGGDGA